MANNNWPPKEWPEEVLEDFASHFSKAKRAVSDANKATRLLNHMKARMHPVSFYPSGEMKKK